MKAPLSAEQKQIALKRIIDRLKPIGRYGAKIVMYTTALGAIAAISGTNLAPELQLLVEGVGINILSSIIEQVARGESIPDSKLQEEVESAIQASNLEDLLTEDYFARALSRIVHNQNKILHTVLGHDYELQQLSLDLVELKHLIEELLSVYPRSTLPKSLKAEESLPIWLEVAQTPGFRGRNKELDYLETALKEIHRVIIYGISGTGKTWVLARLTHRLNANVPTVCWVGLNHYVSVEDIQLIIARFLSVAGLNNLSQIVGRVERANLKSVLVKVLVLSNISLFFDSLNSAHPSVSSFIEELFEATLLHKLKGAILVSSTSIPSGYSQANILQEKVVEIGLGGFSLSETEEILKDTNSSLADGQIIALYEAIGGHPMSVLSLAELFRSTLALSMDAEEMGRRGIEAARDWLLTRVLGTLDARERDILLTMSVFEHPFDDNEAQQVISATLSPKYCLYPLIRRHLISAIGEVYTVHDAIRGLAYDMLSADRREHLHRTLVEYYRDEIDAGLRTDGSVSWLVGLKWSFHLERVTHFHNTEQIIEQLISLDDRYLSALFAISYHGYPFDFTSKDLAFSRRICSYLLNKGLIRRRFFPRRKKPFITKNLDFIDTFLVRCSCIRKGIGNHLGYFDIPRSNYAFRKQGLVCPWEHCIELYPLPPVTKSEWQEHLQELRRLFEEEGDEFLLRWQRILFGEYDDLLPETRAAVEKMLAEDIPEDAPDESDMEMEARSCPIFGHCCPGGQVQAQTCKDNPTSHFTWALTEQKRV